MNFKEFFDRLIRHKKFVEDRVNNLIDRPEQRKLLESMPSDIHGVEKMRKNLQEAIEDGWAFHFKHLHENGRISDYAPNFLLYEELDTIEDAQRRFERKQQYTKSIDDIIGLVKVSMKECFDEIQEDFDNTFLGQAEKLIPIKLEDLTDLQMIEPEKGPYNRFDIKFRCPERKTCSCSSTGEPCTRRLSWKTFLTLTFSKLRPHIVATDFDISALEFTDDQSCGLRVNYKQHTR